MSKKRFFCCIGNPPYQEEVNKNSENKTYAPPLYHTMLDAAQGIADRVEMITPARFLFNAGATPKAWNEKMLNDEHFKVMEYDPDSSKVFPGTDIKGGVAVTYHDVTKTYEPIDTFVPQNELQSVLQKVRAATRGLDMFNTIVSNRGQYRLSDKAIERNVDIAKLTQDGKNRIVGSNAFNIMNDIVFFREKPSDDKQYVKIIGLYYGKRTEHWASIEDLIVPDNFYHYKVFIPAANGSGAIGEVFATPLVGSPLVGSTDTFLSIGNFDTCDEAENCLKYVKTKFARAMLGVLKVTQHNPAPKWRFVPLQDFTAASDIDWSQSIADIDQQLYRKYGLDDDEIAFIEEKIKPMS